MSSDSTEVRLSGRDIRNSKELKRSMGLQKTASVVSSSLEITAKLTRMMSAPGNELYVRNANGSIQVLSLKKWGPEETQAQGSEQAQ